MWGIILCCISVVTMCHGDSSDCIKAPSLATFIRGRERTALERMQDERAFLLSEDDCPEQYEPGVRITLGSLHRHMSENKQREKSCLSKLRCLCPCCSWSHDDFCFYLLFYLFKKK